MQFLKKTLNYLSAEIGHAIKGSVTSEDAKDRLDICMACEFRAVEYKGVKDPRGVGFCAGGCGCGATGRAQLETKVTIAGATCPKSKWKVDPTTQGASLESLKEAVGGIVFTAAGAISQNHAALIEEHKQRILKLQQGQKTSNQPPKPLG